MAELREYTLRNESVTALWFARAFPEQGWKVTSSQLLASGSKVSITPRIELASRPVRPLLAKLARMYEPVQ